MAGPFLPTSATRDLGTKDLDMTALRQAVNNISIMVNSKASGIFPLTETLDGCLWYPDPTLGSATPRQPTWRNEYIKVIRFGALPNTAVKNVAHGITIDANTVIVDITTVATNPGVMSIPIPYASTVDVAHNIEITVGAANITITTAADYSAYTKCDVVLRYLKY